MLGHGLLFNGLGRGCHALGRRGRRGGASRGGRGTGTLLPAAPELALLRDPLFHQVVQPIFFAPCQTPQRAQQAALTPAPSAALTPGLEGRLRRRRVEHGLPGELSPTPGTHEQVQGAGRLLLGQVEQHLGLLHLARDLLLQVEPAQHVAGLVVGHADHRIVHHGQGQLGGNGLVVRARGGHRQGHLLTWGVGLLVRLNLHLEQGPPVAIDQPLGQGLFVQIEDRDPGRALSAVPRKILVLEVDHRGFAIPRLHRGRIDDVLPQHGGHGHRARGEAAHRHPQGRFLAVVVIVAVEHAPLIQGQRQRELLHHANRPGDHRLV